MLVRQKLGLAIGPEPPRQQAQAANVQVSQKKKVNLRSIISIPDYETAASALLPPRAFACRSLNGGT